MKITSRLFLIHALVAGTVHADLVLETETAQLGKQGDGLVSAALQVERDKKEQLLTAHFTPRR